MDRIFLLIVTGMAVIWDLKTKRIPNHLILIGLLAGCLAQIVRFGISGVLFFLSGSLLPIILLAILYFFRMLGAGDIKLLAVIGGFLGSSSGIRCLVYAFLFGALYSFILLIRRNLLKKRLCYFFAYIRNFYHTKKWSPYRKGEESKAEFCFSVAILFGLIVWMGGNY